MTSDISAINERNKQRQEHKLKFSNINNYASSFVFSLPRTIKQPTAKQWSIIINSIFKNMVIDINKATLRDNAKEIKNRNNAKAKYKNKALMPTITLDELKKHSLVVLHDESLSPSKNSHCHVLISNVIKNVVIKPISQKCASYSAKKSFNKAVLKVLNEDNHNYMPIMKKSFNKPLWAAHEDKIKKLELKLFTLKKHYQDIKSDIVDWSKSFLENIFLISKIKATNIAHNINTIEELSPDIALNLDDTVEKIEAKNNSANEEIKISPKRKRRRRKKPII